VWLRSYFFAEPNLALFCIVPHWGKSTVERALQAGIACSDAARPVYAHVSPHIWSAGEGVAFILQERHRVKIVGEITAGAAKAAASYEINSALFVTIPFGHIESAARGMNWEWVALFRTHPSRQTRPFRLLRARSWSRLRRFQMSSQAGRIGLQHPEKTLGRILTCLARISDRKNGLFTGKIVSRGQDLA
jgi:hypothetical protein